MATEGWGLMDKAVTSLQCLVSRGYVADPAQTLDNILLGVVHSSSSGWVLSHQLLRQRQGLSNNQELVLALLGLAPSVRHGWLVIMAARCKEAGHMADGATLVELITQLQGAAAWVVAALSEAQLVMSPTATIERELLGVSAEQAAATPMLARILAVSFALQQTRAETLPIMPMIDASGVQADQNWISGRLLALPGVEVEPAYLLAGLMPMENHISATDWVLSSPWGLLLSMVVYAQYNWAAEARGGLLLELPAGQNAYQPGQIVVLVQGPEGDETLCGTLAQLVLLTLKHLGVHCFPAQPDAVALDALLASIIGQCLTQAVWRYQDGASGQNGQYLIHPHFADACFRLPGSKVFNRTGRHLWQIIRIVAEQWRSEMRRVGVYPKE
ncbi:MAG: hypothetical protein PHO08_10705 [Methylococcales bacterium]|nr:hypothetical protein [Methylococcales bacterium]MDD5630797.1 hypothetical protein [Methylococcales bacterium]